MGIVRIYVNHSLLSRECVALPPDGAHHVARVLRMRPCDPLVLFNGRGGEYSARIHSIGDSSVTAEIGARRQVERESPLAITLAQGISRGERMDYTIQKTVELGVSRIIPLLTERVSVRLDERRQQKRLDHWRKILIHACEQCGRNRVPELTPVADFTSWIDEPRAGLKLILDPNTQTSFASLDAPAGVVTLLVGPEGGLSQHERHRVEAAGYRAVGLGPRVLRSETAAVVAVSALQILFGDLK